LRRCLLLPYTTLFRSCLGFARRDNLPPYLRTSVILGMRIDDELLQVVRFASDPAIPEGLLNETCERCPLLPEECTERAAPPTRWQQQQQAEERHRALALLLQEQPATQAQNSTPAPHPQKEQPAATSQAV